MKTIDTALIYAAGRGTRMGALTETTPKPLLEVNGRALIDYSVALVEDAGIQNIHVNAAYLGDQIGRHFAGTNVQVHYEPDGPYETGGTLKALAKTMPDAILTLNSDVMFFEQNPIPALIEAWNARDDIDAILTLLPRECAIGHMGQGDFFWDHGAISRRGDAPSAPYIFPSVQIIRPSVANAISERIFSTNLIWDQLIASGRIAGEVYQGKWMDLGTAQSLERARKELVLQ